jgi:tRNA pseudouridine38-40 synthase
MRIVLGVEYDGANYHGWQRQNNVCTIQEKVEYALAQVAAEPIDVICAGRTDAGVHALGQVVHFDTAAMRSDRAWILGTNTNLPSDIRVLWARHTSSDFHARFSATARQYRYIIYNNKVASAILRQRTMWLPFALDEKLMHEAGRYLIGENDFSSFRGSSCQAKSAERNIISLVVTRNSSMVTIDIKADAFLLHMVRCIVGTLVKVGEGEKPPSWVKEVLIARDRRLAAATAPAQGLYLVEVEYGVYTD